MARFTKGQSGNPGGKPKRAKMFERELMAALKEAGPDGEKLRQVARALVDQAIAGNVTAIREIADRIDGKVPQALNHAGDPDNPILPLVPVINVTIGDAPKGSRAFPPSEQERSRLNG
jgi:hypothetical protein